MRKLLITLAILVLIVALFATWIFFGRRVSLFVDRFATVEIASTPIKSIVYEGSGTGGWFTVNDLHFGLDDVNPKIALSIGSTKDDQLAVASAGKVFAFGPLIAQPENRGDNLGAVPQQGDDAVFVTRRSALSWPTPFELNLMTGHSPSWKRLIYYELRWKKSSGATLDMLWRYEQSFYGKQLYPDNGWDNGFGVHDRSTGLIKVDIHP